MHALLSAAGRSFLRAFVASIIVLGPGILAAPNLDGAVTLGIAAVVASIAAGLKAIQVFLPQVSFVPYVKAPFGDWLDSFARAFLAAFVTALIGILAMPDFGAWKSAAIAALTGAIAAGIRAVQGLFTPGEKPASAVGLVAADPPTVTRRIP